MSWVIAPLWGSPPAHNNYKLWAKYKKKLPKALESNQKQRENHRRRQECGEVGNGGYTWKKGRVLGEFPGRLVGWLV